MKGPLNGKTIIDLSHRLPGPLAGKLLASLGAKVIKIEDKVFKDPFIEGLFATMDNSFPIWYEHINKQKEILRFDFNDQNDIKKIWDLVSNADGIIMGLPPKMTAKLGLNFEDLTKMNKPLAVVYPLASKTVSSNMHDLNALALTGLLTLHAKTHSAHSEDLTPPFLPIAGINFGNKMALDLVSCMLRSVQENKVCKIESYLFESTKEVYESFWPEELRGESLFLHNGLYPCYNIYKTKDNRFVVMACVEEKFWIDACRAFSWKYTNEQRFETSGNIHRELRDYFGAMTIQEIQNLLGNLDICINLL